MLVLSNAKESEAVAVTEKILRVGGPAAGEAVDARGVGRPSIRARQDHRVASAAAFDHAAFPEYSYSNNAVGFYLRDVAEECPVFHGADEACAATVDAALGDGELAGRAAAESAVAAVLDAGGGAAAAAAIAWCAQNPGAAHVDVVERLARAKAKAADAEREAMGA